MRLGCRSTRPWRPEGFAAITPRYKRRDRVSSCIPKCRFLGRALCCGELAQIGRDAGTYLEQHGHWMGLPQQCQLSVSWPLALRAAPSLQLHRRRPGAKLTGLSDTAWNRRTDQSRAAHIVAVSMQPVHIAAWHCSSCNAPPAPRTATEVLIRALVANERERWLLTIETRPRRDMAVCGYVCVVDAEEECGKSSLLCRL